MLKRALKAEEDLTGFYKLTQEDDILHDVIKRPLWHAHDWLARTVSSVNLSGFSADGAHEKKQPNDGSADG